MAQVPLIRQDQAGNADIDGASPSCFPTSPNQNMPHRWRISFHPEEQICPKNGACFQTIPNHIDGASQARAWWWGQKPVSKCVCQCQPFRLLNFHVWDAHGWRKSGKGMMIWRGQSSVCKYVCQCQPSLACWGMLGGMRDLCHLCGHSQPDFGEWVGLTPSMSPYSASRWTFASVFLGFAPRAGEGYGCWYGMVRHGTVRYGMVWYCVYVCLSVCMYVCMHACMYARTQICMYACMHVCMHACMHVCMYACMHACMHVCMYACMHVWMYGCMVVCMYVWMDGWMYGCMDVWMYGCMDVWMYVCMYVCMYGCMYVCMVVCMYVM